MKKKEYPKILIYGKDTCGFCTLAKEKFKNSNMMYFRYEDKQQNIDHLQEHLNYPYFPMIFFKTKDDNRYIFKGGWSDVQQ